MTMLDQAREEAQRQRTPRTNGDGHAEPASAAPKTADATPNNSRSPLRREGFCANPFPKALPASELATTQSEAASWVVDGLLRRGNVTLFSALWKSGKTTWLSHLYRSLETQGWYCGRKVQPCGVLIVSEETVDLWVERRDKLVLGDHCFFLIRPLKGKPDLPTWKAFIDYLAHIVVGEGLGLVILDTISTFWPVKDENNASEVMEALMPLRQLTDAQAAVLLAHHPRKSDGQEATAARGSGALSGWADIILELRRFNASNRGDRRRVITGYSRYSATPAEMVVELSEDGLRYDAQGDRQEATLKERTDAILRILPAVEPGWTTEEVLDAYPAKDKPAKRTLEQVLAWGVDQGHWRVCGAGKKGDPYHYWTAP